MTDKLKKSRAQRLLTELRNRMVHVPPLLDKVTIYGRTRNHADGAGAHLCAHLTERAMIGIDEKLPTGQPS